MFKRSFLIIFVSVVEQIYGQQGRIDSLGKLISGTKKDTAKIELYEKLGQTYRDAKKMDSAILSYQQALEINEKNNYSLQRQCWDITQVSFDLDNLLNERNANVEIIDEKNEDETPAGTAVIIVFKPCFPPSQ